MPVVHHGIVAPKLCPGLHTSSHVFLRVDAVKRPLTPPYEGPYEVLERSEKTFKILKGGKSLTVSVDRLKPVTCALPPPTSTSASSSAPAASSAPLQRPPPAPTPTPPPAPTPAPPRSYAEVVASPERLSGQVLVSTRSGRVSRPVLRYTS